MFLLAVSTAAAAAATLGMAVVVYSSPYQTVAAKLLAAAASAWVGVAVPPVVGLAAHYGNSPTANACVSRLRWNISDTTTRQLPNYVRSIVFAMPSEGHARSPKSSLTPKPTGQITASLAMPGM